MTRVLFLADQFSDTTRGPTEGHPGGAELTDDVAIRACPWPLTKRTFRALNAEPDGFLNGFDVIVVGNSETASRAQLLLVAASQRHVLFEHDLRICRFRGNFPVGRDALHRTLQHCWCPHLELRALFDGARGTLFLTRLQERYYRDNPFFACENTRILGSSLFGAELLEAGGTVTPRARAGTSVFASRHAVKGYREALRHCRQHDIAPFEIRDLSPAAVLELFARSQRFVYLPIGPEWAGRMVVEARVLGCEVVANQHVGVVGEPFWSEQRGPALAFLAAGPARFWRLVEELMNAPAAVMPRATSPLVKAVDGLSRLLRAPRRAFWPAGFQPLVRKPPHSYRPW
jgi:hypothetical protein